MSTVEMLEQARALKNDLETKKRTWGYIQFEYPKVIKQQQKMELLLFLSLWLIMVCFKTKVLRVQNLII